MNDKTLQNLCRRLEKWELDHLRKLAAELNERLERTQEKLRRAEEEASRAWDMAEFWRENAMELQEALMAEDFDIGLTKEGQMAAMKRDLSPDVEVRNEDIEKADAPAHEDHAVAVLGSSQDHQHPCAYRFGTGNLDAEQIAGEPGRVEVIAEQTDALVTGVGNRAGLEVADEHGNAEPLGADTNRHDGQLNTIDGRQQLAADFHESPLGVAWPGDGNTQTPIDWSPLAGRAVILHAEGIENKPPKSND